MNNSNTKKLILSALFLAMGFVLPMITGQIPAIGQVLLPMHIPVFLCGMICDWKYGAIIGFILPIFRSLLFSVPVMYPTAIAIAFEMSVYGAVVGLLYGYSKKKSILSIYIAMLVAMIAGRIIRIIAEIILLKFVGKTLAFYAYVSVTFIHSLPGIALQLVLIPLLMLALKKAKLVE